MEKTIKDFIKPILEEVELTEDITLNVFLKIEKTTHLLREYIHLLIIHSQDNLNRQIGKIIRENLDLENTGRVQVSNSALIKSYEKH